MKNMELGIFTPEVVASSVAEMFKKVHYYGFSEVQFNFLSAGKEEMPEVITDELLDDIALQAKMNKVKISVINGTFNMAHPEKEVRENGVKRFLQIAVAANRLGCPYISICTGTRDRNNMWVPHADNSTQEAWNDMKHSVDQVLEIAEAYKTVLLIEPEASNVCNSPEKVLHLIQSTRSERLKVIMDCANLFQAGMAYRRNVRDVISNAFDLLGEYVVIAHGKDVHEGEGLDFTYAGNGIVDFEFFIRKLDDIGFVNGMILHGTKSEDEIPLAVAHVRKVLGII